MKYFFLADGWTFERVWEFGGLWKENIRRRQPKIERLKLGVVEQNQILWLYQVEDAVIMIEVKPINQAESVQSIGQVLLKRLISAEQVIEYLCQAESLIN